VDNSSRSLHGALLDSEILADVYLLMTGGQVDMNIGQETQSEYDQNNTSEKTKKIDKDRKPIKVVFASSEELISHEKNLQDIEDSSGICVWKENSY
jgi:DNA polymerase-3 subunit epsilon